MEQLFTFRGFDTAICSMDWIKYIPEVHEEEDLFDKYTIDMSFAEFGVPQKDSYVKKNGAEKKEERSPLNIVSNENFDFKEACEALKEEILTAKENDDVAEKNEDTSDTNPTREECQSNFDIDIENEKCSTQSIESQTCEKDLFWLVCSSEEHFLLVWDLNNGQMVDRIPIAVPKYQMSFTSEY